MRMPCRICKKIHRNPFCARDAVDLGAKGG
jgi:hypothetical protein